MKKLVKVKHCQIKKKKINKQVYTYHLVQLEVFKLYVLMDRYFFFRYDERVICYSYENDIVKLRNE